MQVFGGQGFIDFDSPPVEVTKEAQDAACEMAGRKARKHMESLAELQKVLRRLRTGLPLEKMEYDCDGGRVAALVHILRKSYGFAVGGHGTVSDPYVMKDTQQTPSLAGVTDEMKETYYCLPHWHSKRQERFDMDGHACVLCRDTDDLQCHHVTYKRLFREDMSDLMTVCRYHHEVIHTSCKLKFPCGISSEFAYQIGWKGPDAWLLP
jgi:hypothetical protein